MNTMMNYRPIPFYFINTRDEEHLSLKAIREAMRRVAEQRFGGIVLFNKPPDGFSPEEYLEEAWFAMTERFVLACREYGLELWINDGYNFPPGDAGGRIQRVAPHLTQKILVLRDSGEIGVDELEWGFPAFEEPESSELFIHFVYEAYRARLGQYFGNGITGFFSDADNRRVTPFCAEKLGKRPYFPWSGDFARRFQQEYGYDPEPFLARLLRGEGGAFAHDYWQLAGRLYQQWFRNNSDWCHRHGLLYSFHTSDTGPFSRRECPRSSVFTEGDVLEFLAASDCPGTDHELLRLDGGTHYDRRYYTPAAPWGAEFPAKNDAFADTRYDFRAKYAASAAWLHGKPRVLCEAFAATNWGATYQDLRRIATWQLMQGINLFVPHAVHHRLFGETKYFAPPEFSLSPMWRGVREFNDFLARYAQLAARGEYVAPVAVIDPTPAVWRGEAEGECLAALCDRLNRQPVGYHIVSAADAGRFEVVMDPARGVEAQLPATDISFTGDGELHYMERRDSDGRRFLLVANVWRDDNVTGVLRFDGREVALTVAPGEIAVIGGAEEHFSAPLDAACRAEALEVEITLADVPLVPLRDLREWTLKTDLPELELLVPEAWSEAVACDGAALRGGKRERIFDDPYIAYRLPAGEGTHRLRLAGAEPPPEMPLYLRGNFSCRVYDAPTAGAVYQETYNLRMLSARGARLELDLPPVRLTVGDLGAQGYPFYAGCVRYRLRFAALETPRTLVFPDAGHITEVWANGAKVATVIFDGTRVEVPPVLDGWIELRQYNVLGNQLEGCHYANGLRRLPYL